MTDFEPTKEEILENDKYFCGCKWPTKTIFARGEGSYLWDTEGKKYVDFYAGIAVTSLGHCNPDVTKIISEQAGTLLHTGANKYASTMAKTLVEKTKEFGGMYNASNVFLSNSGAEANEAALKFARKYGQKISPDKTEIICFESSFHGRTFGALSVTSNTHYQESFVPLVPGIKTAKAGDIASVEKVISDKTCAVIIEPVQGEGGVHPVDHQFLIDLKKLCTKNKAILIYDEVQCGVGRTGTLWAHAKLPKEGHPDIFTSAKAIANGYPAGATIMTEAVSSILKTGDHGNTFGGNPPATRVGIYVLQTIANQKFLDGVNAKAKLFNEGLGKLKEKFPERITEIRGEGLMIGLQLTENPGKIMEKAGELGLLLIPAGGNVIRFTPALNIPDEVIAEGLAILEKAFEAVPAEKKD